MILSAEQVRLIRAGKKTEMRVKVVDPASYQPTRKTARGHVPSGPPRDTAGNEPKVGQQIPISTIKIIDGDRAPVRQCSIEITNYERALLGKSITLQTARAEGHRTTDDYRIWWVLTYDRAWAVANTNGPEQILARFDDRHQYRLVWAMTFKHVADAGVRYLATEPNRVESDYTTQARLAVRIGGDALDQLEQAKYSDQGRDHHDLRQAGAAERDLDRLRGLDGEIRDLRQFAFGTPGLDLRKELKRLQQTRDSIERAIRQQVRGQRAA